jgi:hypothetical protein
VVWCGVVCASFTSFCNKLGAHVCEVNWERPEVVPIFFLGGGNFWFYSWQMSSRIGCEHRIPLTTVRTPGADKYIKTLQNYQCHLQWNVWEPEKMLCWRWSYYYGFEYLSSKLREMNSTLTRQKPKRIHISLKASFCWCSFTQIISLVLKFMTSLKRRTNTTCNDIALYVISLFKEPINDGYQWPTVLCISWKRFMSNKAWESQTLS